MAKQQSQSNTRSHIRFDEPKMYDVMLINDDFTTMEFVVQLLCIVFYHSQNDAMNIMLKVHHEGKGVAGTYTLDIAKAKVAQATNIARSEGFPLNLQIEPHTSLPY